MRDMGPSKEWRRLIAQEHLADVKTKFRYSNEQKPTGRPEEPVQIRDLRCRRVRSRPVTSQLTGLASR